MNAREFLKSKKALTKFKVNFNNQKEEWSNELSVKEHYPFLIEMSPDRFLRESDKEESLSYAFAWCNTVKNNAEYWENLNTEYRKQL